MVHLARWSTGGILLYISPIHNGKSCAIGGQDGDNSYQNNTNHDNILLNSYSEYSDLLKQYKKIVASRNKLLKSIDKYKYCV